MFAPLFMPSDRWRTSLMLYSSVHFGKTLLWVGEDALALYLMIGLLKLPPALAGSLFLVSALLNAACDGLFGKLLPRWPGLMRRLPAMLWGIVPLAGLSFAALPFLPVGNLLPALALLMLFRLSFSLADVSHNAMIQPLAVRHGHLAIARLRAFLSGSASLVVACVAFVALNAGDDKSLISLLICGLGLVAIAMMAPLPALLRHFGERISPDIRLTPERHGRGNHEPDGLFLFCLLSALGLSALASIGKAILHIEFQLPTVGAAALVLITAGRIGSIWIWTPIARRLGNRPALSLAYLISGATTFLLPALAEGTFGAGTVLLLILVGMTGGGVALLSWAVLSELIEARSASTGDGVHITAVAIFSMSIKIALALSGILVGTWLSAQQDPLHSDPADFLPLALVVFLITALTAALILRKAANPQGVILK